MRSLLALAFRSAVALLTVFLLLVTPGLVKAQLDPAAICAAISNDSQGTLARVDSDGDGFLDGEECDGLSKEINQTLPETYLTWPGWKSTAANKFNPAKRDILVVLVRSLPDSNGNPTTKIPPSPFEYISNAPPYGLGTNVYEIPGLDAQTVLNANRLLIQRTDGTFHNAVKITESLSASSVLGRCDETWATPNGLDNCFVFTKAIIDHVDGVCASLSNKGNCKDSLTYATPLTSPSIYDVYIKHTIAHECGHDIKLRGIYVSSTGGYHYAATDKVVLSQSVFYKASKSAVAWYIGTRYFSPNDQQDYVLWESAQ